MLRTTLRSASALLLVGLAAMGCSSGSGGGSGQASSAPGSTATPTSSSTTGSTKTGSTGSTGSVTSTTTSTGIPAGAQAAPLCVPVIVIHGHTGNTAGLLPFVNAYGRGRTVIPEIYAAEADALKAGSLPLATIVNAGYYKDSINGALYDPDASGRGQGSIGSCATPRDDGNQGLYPISYAARIARIVDGVRRATGSDRVDLVCHSMGNLVGRAYTRWLSDNGNHSKVRKLFCVAGPQRGINALEALIDGLDNAGKTEFMIDGENMEMCYEYNGWGNDSFVNRLNDGWDTFCTQMDVHYGGITGLGAQGKQVDPNGHALPQPVPGSILSIFGVNLNNLGLGGSFGSVAQGLQNLTVTNLGQTFPLWAIAVPQLFSELPEALGPGDGTVRFESSRMDKAPFLGAEFWAQYEGRHSGDWNVEQVGVNSSFATELAREYLAYGSVPKGGIFLSADLRVVDSNGHASWLALETNVQQGALVTAQVVEEQLDASGNPVGGAAGYSVPVPAGDHTSMLAVPAGSANRRYRVVVYDAAGAVYTKDQIALTLKSGTLETAPATSVDTATGLNGVVHVTASSNAPAGDPSLKFSYRLDGGAWSAWTSSPTFDTPALAAGEHRLQVRSENAHNAAATLVEDLRGAEVGLVVDSLGNATVRR